MKIKKSKFDISQLMRRNKALKVIAEQFRRELIEKQTEAEKAFKAHLKALKIRFEFQRIIYSGGSFYIVDFYLPKYKIAVEIDGKHHKYDEEKASADADRTYNLILSGLNGVVRFENKEVYDEEACFRKIKNLIL